MVLTTDTADAAAGVPHPIWTLMVTLTNHIYDTKAAA